MTEQYDIWGDCKEPEPDSPKCDYKYIVRSDRICYGCGQALDWSDEK